MTISTIKIPMPKHILASGAVLLSFLFPLRARATTYSQIYVFGDSLVDTGNLFELTFDKIPPSPPYFKGRFSNGPIWVEYLAENLNLSFDPENDFAYGGATTGETNVTVPLAPGLLDQIARFTNSSENIDPNALYIIWAGSNDYLNEDVTEIGQPIGNISTAIVALAADGAKNFLVPNLPDLGRLPSTKNTEISNQLNRLARFHNIALAGALKSLENSLGTNVDITLVDMNLLFKKIVNNPANFGFTNQNEACLNFQTRVVCDNPSEYAFWDILHPTTAVHKIMGEFAFSALDAEEAEQFSEPISRLTVLGSDLFDASASLKRKRQELREISQ